MYHEVDADGGGSVSLQEFEDWFRATQRTQVLRRVMGTSSFLSPLHFGVSWFLVPLCRYCRLCKPTATTTTTSPLGYGR